MTFEWVYFSVGAFYSYYQIIVWLPKALKENDPSPLIRPYFNEPYFLIFLFIFFAVFWAPFCLLDLIKILKNIGG